MGSYITVTFQVGASNHYAADYQLNEVLNELARITGRGVLPFLTGYEEVDRGYDGYTPLGAAAYDGDDDDDWDEDSSARRRALRSLRSRRHRKGGTT